ncbi:MAG TPA: RnfABCDGE type electron transport complex subunit B [Gammaproteobacteria bacterium]|nr:RnfABCDGE type electron transport complex subunit B [Gammaproteobacteria bacterium]
MLPWLLLAIVGLAAGFSVARPARDPGKGLALAEETDRIDALLPQTQCGLCGYRGCRPYAEAVVRGEAAINRCPPGGTETVAALADLLGVEPMPAPAMSPPRVALIDEATCIGCTLCLDACPVDAIIGAPKLMHTVIAALCTGCGLCLPPCPVDCIQLRTSGG